jgi:cytochrome b561/polyisoprenoid-binding protein YceI
MANPGDERLLHEAQARYSVAAIVLHWAIAALVLAQLMLASRMGGRTPEAFALMQLHKSIGLTILLLTIVRLGWRLTHRPPPMPPLTRWERILARAVHVAFYILTIALPLTGWLMVSSSRLAVPTRLFGVVPWPHAPGVATLPPAQKAMAFGASQTGHAALAWIAMALVAVHVAGALKHQLLAPGAPVLTRMAPGAKAGRWLEPRLGAVLLGALMLATAAGLASPPFSAHAPASPGVAQYAVRGAAATADVVAFGNAPTPPLARRAPPSTEPLPWTVSDGARLSFATAWSGEPITGRFTRWRAQIHFSPAALDRSKVVVSVDLRSVDTGNVQRDEALRGPDWFDVAARRSATFAATRFESLGEGRYVAHGVLTLRGAERRLSVPFHLRIDGLVAKASGEADVDRTAFTVGQGEFAATDQVPGAVKVTFRLTARAPPA